MAAWPEVEIHLHYLARVGRKCYFLLNVMKVSSFYCTSGNLKLRKCLNCFEQKTPWDSMYFYRSHEHASGSVLKVGKWSSSSYHMFQLKITNWTFTLHVKKKISLTWSVPISSLKNMMEIVLYVRSSFCDMQVGQNAKQTRICQITENAFRASSRHELVPLR